MEKQQGKPIIRATQETHRELRLVAALTGETMQAVIRRLVKEELARLQQRNPKGQ
jgi:hypothetical protein